MKKQSLKWLALLLAVVLCAGFASCKDDDDEDNGGNLSTSIIGSWEYRDMDGAGYVIETYRFNADGTYEVDGSEGTYSSDSHSTWWEGGVYELDGRTLTLICQVSSTGYVSGPVSYTVSIEGSQLTLTDEDGDKDTYYKD